MLGFYRIKAVVVILALVAILPHFSVAQCSFTNLNTTYCTNEPAFVLSAGSATTFIGNGVSGGVFDPAVAGAGTHIIIAHDQASSYGVVTSGTFNRVSPPGTETTLSLATDTDSGILGVADGFFDFDFFGTTYNQLRIGSNGLIGLGTGAVTDPGNQTLPDGTDPNNIIAAIWDNMTGTGTIKYWTVGSVPNRTFIIDFDLVRSGSLASEIAQVKLFETTNVIEIHTQTASFTNGNAATQGIENSTGSIAYFVTGRNSEGWNATNDFKSFVPLCYDQKTVTVYAVPSTGLNVAPNLSTTCVGGSVNIIIQGAQAGFLYQLQNNLTASPLSGFYAGTGGNLVIPTNALSVDVPIRVYARNASSPSCDEILTEVVNVTIDPSPAITVEPVATQNVCEGSPATLSVTATGSGLSYQWRKNGVDISGETADTYTIASTTSGDAGLYTVVVSGTCSPSVTSINSELTINEQPEIITGPVSQTVCAGQSVTFTVNAGVTTGVTYQWRKGGVNIGGATGSSYTIPVTVAADAGSYDVVVSGTCTPPVTSAAATLTIDALPAITGQPAASQAICEGSTATFTVTATGTSLTYQWKKNGVDIVGATASTYTIPATVTADAGTYTVVVSGTCTPGVTSIASVLTINEQPEIITGPVSQTVCAGQSVTFTVNAGVTTGVTYQWRKGGVNIGGATGSSYTIPVTVAADAGSYDVVVSGTCTPPVTSAPAVLVIDAIPVIVTGPLSSTICEGSNTTFTVDAGVTTGASYQWQVSVNGGVSYANITDGGIYSGSTTSTLNLNVVPLTNNGNLYRVIVSGTCAPPVNSNGALLTVNQNVVINTQPITQTICEGSSVIFSVVAVGTGLTYQWRENGVNISDGGVYSGATTATLTMSNVPNTFNGRAYSVIVTGTCSSLPSASATLTVNRIPNAFAADAAICSGQTTNISITNPNAVPSTTFTWTIQSSNNVSNAAPGSGNVIAQTLTSTDGVSVGTVTYLIQPAAAGCAGTPYAVTVTVNPIPDVAASPQTICSGTSTSIAITNPNGVSGTSFSWTILTSTNVTGASAGTGSTISQVLTSTDGVTSGTVTYRIVPTANGCSGSFVDVVVAVSPRPAITNSSTSLIQEICSGTSLNFLPTSTIGGTTFSWTSSVIGVLSNVSPSGNGSITDTPVNATNTSAVIIYEITPSVSGCNGAPVNFVVTVRPVPTATANPQTICSGQSTSILITNPNAVAGTTFSWTILTSTNATGALNGSGNVISQVLSATDGLTNGTVTYRITASSNGCPGPSVDVVATVRPVPVVTNTPSSLSQQICSGQALNFVPTASIGGTTFSWTSTVTGPITPASVTSSGTGSITDTPINTGNVDGIVTYRIIPSFNGCDGLPVDFVVTVKPLPSASASDITICSGGTALINISPTPKNVAGTTFAWTVTPSANVTGAADGNGSTISQVLNTTNAIIGTVVYTITPTANGCNGPITVVTATVNPVATVNAGADFAVCEPLTIPLSGTLGGSATTAAWTFLSGTGSISATTVSGSTVTAIYTVGSGDISTNITFELSTNDPDGAGPCSVVTDQVVVSVNRQARLTLPADYTVCEPSSIPLIGTLSGSATSGVWSLLAGSGTLSASSVTGSDVTATYIVSPSDVNTTLRFRLTTNDPDGFGPCVAEFDEIDILVNESAKVNAGADFEVCENQQVNLAAVASGTTTSVLWSGGSGAAQFSPVNNVNSVYTLTPADIAAGSIALTITTNDPDAGGPCTTTSDQVVVTINKLPDVFLSGLEPSYAENDPVDYLDGFPLGGTFSGPGIIGVTNAFNPSFAGFGVIKIRYTYTDANACTNFTEKTTIVNPVTNVDFYILEDNRSNAAGMPQICANQGRLSLIGIPPASTGQNPTLFKGLSAELVSRVTTPDNINWKLDTDGLLAGTYQLQYIYTNQFFARDTLTKDLIVFSAPVAVIDVGNNCQEDLVTFTESSSIPNNLSSGTIVNWNWFFDEDANGSNGPVPEPQYLYQSPGQKNIRLEVLTDQGCRHSVGKTIVIGVPPVVDFSWTSYCEGDATQFTDLTSAEFGVPDAYAWDFDDGQSSTQQNPSHQFAQFGVYDVTFTVGTDAGCSGSATKQVYIQDLITVLGSAPYSTDFESGQGTWVPVASDTTVDYSWTFGTPAGTLVTAANSGANAWWTGANSNSYYNNEKSFVIGPCLDISGLKRPMVSLKYFVNTQKGFDGAVVQYSTNGGATWETVGDAEGGGINWYNSRNLTGEPGGQSNFAWSDDLDTAWRDARYNLDQIPLALRDTVIFRIAFGSNDDNQAGVVVDGFAFDDIFIGEKGRNVLVEHFTNALSPAGMDATQFLESKYVEQFAVKDSSDFILVQYHIGNPGDDPINDGNPTDPQARALLYGVSQPPTTLMDGIQGEYFGTNFNGSQTLISAEELDRRALESPAFEITFNPVTGGNPDSPVQLSITFTYIDSLKTLTTPVTLHAGLFERGVPGSGTTHGNVMRKLFLTGAGKTLTRTWTFGDFETVTIDYTLDVPVTNPDSLYILAFAQDQLLNSKRLLQAAITKTSPKNGIAIVGLPDDPISGEIRELAVYPNPASKHFNMYSEVNLSRTYTWQLIDQRGVTVLSGDLNQDFTHGAQQVDVSELANGIYFLAIQTGEKSIVHKKIAIMNRN